LWSQSCGWEAREPAIATGEQQEYDERSSAVPRSCNAALLAGILILPVAAARHPLLAAQEPGFRTGVDVVAMNVTVTDPASHRFMQGLGERDFQVLEDGRPQQLTFFQRESPPIAVALLFDTSASMNPHLAVAQDAAIGLVRALRPTDVASIVGFDVKTNVRQDFTSDRAALERAIPQRAAGRGTALYNAVYITLKELAKQMDVQPGILARRRAMVILSDGEDTSSLIGFDQVLECAARADVLIYTVGLHRRELPGPRRPEDPDYVLRHLAELTGGRPFFPADAQALTGVYSEIRNELANQYLLAYQPNNTQRDGRFRRIAVRVGHGDAVTRARQGYYAPNR
jgi:Ca-activated chloride channel family protein